MPDTTRGIDPHPDDEINHPKHYNSHPSGIECIEIVRHHNFNVGSAMKYIWRHGLKGSEPDVAGTGIAIQDLEKARWHLADEIKRLGGTPR